MKALFLPALKNISIPGLYGRGFRLSPTHFLTNDSGVVKSLFTRPLQICAGKLEIEALMHAGAVLYSIEDFTPSEPIDAETETRLNDHLFFTRILLMCLWLVKDNGATSELGFFEYPYKSPAAQVSSNFLSASFCDARGKRVCQSFSRDELEHTRHFLHNLVGVNGPESPFTLPHPTVPSDSTRVEIAWLFAQVARSADSLDMKIAHYITCMESLLSSDPSELSHKLSERVALMLGRQVDDRKQIYRTMKTAYTMRSQTVHTGKLAAKNMQQAADISTTCDTYLRQSLIKIFSLPKLMVLFAGKQESLDEYFNGLIFEGGAPETEAP